MDWQAKWIWANGHTDTPNFYLYARKEIDLSDFQGAKAFVTCSSEYNLYINGRFVGRGPSPCHPTFQYFDEYDISHYLRSGKNVIAAICYNYGVGTHCRPQAPGGFLLQAEIKTGPNDFISLCSDESWKVKPADEWDFNSAQMFWTIGFQETYDSRKKPVGWNVVGFDDSGWQEPLILGEVGIEPWVELIPRQIPLLKQWSIYPEQVLKCGTITPANDPNLDIATRMYKEPTQKCADIVTYAKGLLKGSQDVTVIEPGQDAFVVLDFGREVVGYPVIKVRDGGGAIIDIGYSEALDNDGNVFPVRQSILQADRLILHGGRQEFQTFGRRAFRYMQLTIRNHKTPVYIDGVSVNCTGYPLEQASSFECSDELLNEIWRIGLYTLSVCMQDQFEDCPLREHGQYPGDARVQALQNYYSYFDAKLPAKALQQFVQNQKEDGLFNALWPSSTNHILPDYNLVWVMMLHDYHLHTGDSSLTRTLYANLRLLLENWVRSQESENGLLIWEPNPSIPMHEWWLFIDHAPLDKRGEVAAYNAFYYQTLQDAARLAESIGNSDDAAMWSARAEDVYTAFNDRFWCENRGVYVDCNVGGVMSETVSIQTNSLAVLFGLAEKQRETRIKDYFTSDNAYVASSGPYFNFYVLQAMAKLGMENEALTLIRTDWGEMLNRGATTWWETFDRKWEENKVCPDSLCHAWSGAPTYYLPAEVLGIKPSNLDSNDVVIRPRPGNLNWAKGRIKTRGGDIVIEWQRDDKCFKIDINAPGHFIVALPINGFKNPEVHEIDLTPETPLRKARKTFGWGDIIWMQSEERDPYLDWLRSQGETPPDHYKTKRRCYADEECIWVYESPSMNMRYEIREAAE